MLSPNDISYKVSLLVLDLYTISYEAFHLSTNNLFAKFQISIVKWFLMVSSLQYIPKLYNYLIKY